MKCPKCGYLGFETTDRCRNCQYDFSLAPFSAEPELALQDGDLMPDPSADFELPGLARQTSSVSGPSLDLDRLFGDAEPVQDEVDTAGAPGSTTSAPSALPFDDAPLLAPPRAARPPLAVRRTTPEIPKNRTRTTRPVKVESALAFDADPPATPTPDTATRSSAVETVASLMAPPPLAVRIGAGAIDVALLATIDALIVILTLRIAGLQTTTGDVRVLPPIPFLGFLALLAFGYVASFTVAGGQTIGKMLLKLRVIGDDGRPVDAAGGVLRAAGCMLVPVTLGLSYVPVLFTSDHRALHDRLAGTRVVHE